MLRAIIKKKCTSLTALAICFSTLCFLSFTGSAQPIGQHQYYDDNYDTRTSKIITTRNKDIVSVFLTSKQGALPGDEVYTTVIQRTDGNLNAIWSRSFTDLTVTEIIEAKNGDFIVSGSEFYITAAGARNRVCLIRIANDGTLVWRYNGRLSAPAANGSFLNTEQRIAETKSEKIYFQSGSLIAAPNDFAAFYISKTGNLIWTKRISYPSGFTFTDLTTTFDDNLLICGVFNGGQGSGLAVIDSLGRPQFIKKIGGGRGSEVVLHQILKDTINRQYYFCGDYVDPRNSRLQAIVCKTGADLLNLNSLPGTIAYATLFPCADNEKSYGIDAAANIYCLYINRESFSNNRGVYDSASAYIQIPAYKYDAGLNVSWRKRYIIPAARTQPLTVTGASQLVVINDKVLAGMETKDDQAGGSAVKRTAWLQITDTAGSMGNCFATTENFTSARISFSVTGLRANLVFAESGLLVPSQELAPSSYSLQRNDTCIGKRKPKSNFHYRKADPGASSSFVCIGSFVSFTDSSYWEPQTWQWAFPPEADLSNADSSCFPNIYKVKFTQPGVFPVTLIVRNDQGTDTITKYITVVDAALKPALGDDRALCPGDSVLLIYSNAPYTTHYFFQLNGPLYSTKDTVVIKTPGVYVCAASSACGTQYDTITIQLAARPAAGFQPATTCGSLMVSFLNTSSGNGSLSLLYQWQFLDKNNVVLGTSSLPDPNFTYAVFDTVKAKLIVTSPLGCVAPDTIEKLIVLRQKPTASFTFTESCGSKQAAFTSVVIIAGDSITSYQWYFGDGNTSAAANPVHSYPAIGTYQVQLVATSSGGCSDIASLPVTLRTKPVAAFSYNNNACEGQPFTLKDSSAVTGSTVTNYSWQIPSLAQAYTTATIQPVIATAGPALILYSVTSAQGCASDTLRKTILVESLPVAGFNSSNGCEGQTISFTSTGSTNVGSISLYQWATSNGLSSAQQNPSFNFTTPGSYTIKHKLISTNGCVSNEATKTITIFPLPRPSFTTTAPCLNTLVGFTNTTPDAGGTNWQWKVENAVFSTQQNPSYRFTAPADYTITLEATDANGCEASVSKLLRVENFVLQVTASRNPLVYGDAVVLQTAVPVPYSILSWEPSFLFPDQAAKTQRLFLDSSKRVQVIALSQAGCRDTAFLQLHVDYLDDVYIPSAFTPNGDGRNETVQARGNIKELELRIFNRWGAMVFYTTDKTKGWDGTLHGKPQPGGTYVYLAKIIKQNGQAIEKKGTVTLIK